MNATLDDKVLAIVAEVNGLKRSQVTPQSTLTGDLAMDSPTLLHLLVELEAAFDVTISDRAAAELGTVGDLIEYLRGLI